MTSPSDGAGGTGGTFLSACLDLGVGPGEHFWKVGLEGSSGGETGSWEASGS